MNSLETQIEKKKISRMVKAIGNSSPVVVVGVVVVVTSYHGSIDLARKTNSPPSQPLNRVGKTKGSICSLAFLHGIASASATQQQRVREKKEQRSCTTMRQHGLWFIDGKEPKKKKGDQGLGQIRLRLKGDESWIMHKRRQESNLWAVGRGR